MTKYGTTISFVPFPRRRAGAKERGREEKGKSRLNALCDALGPGTLASSYLATYSNEVHICSSTSKKEEKEKSMWEERNSTSESYIVKDSAKARKSKEKKHIVCLSSAR